MISHWTSPFVIESFEDYYGVKYPILNLSTAHFSQLVLMEELRCVTYREVYLVVDEGTQPLLASKLP